MLKGVIRIFLIIFGLDVIASIVGFFTPINDTKPTFADTLYWFVENVLGFPLSLINRDYPFLLDSTFSPLMIILVIVNDAILAIAMWCIIRIIKKLWK